MRVTLLGPPGSGKGTQGQRLAQAWGVPHVASGDIIRDHIARRTAFGRQVEAAIAGGEFAPDADIAYWIARRLSCPEAKNGWILDGFPRNVPQAHAFDEPLAAVIELEIDEAALIERLAGRLVCPVCDEIYHVRHRPPKTDGVCDNDDARLVRRPDDESDAVRHRLQVYEERTLPLRAFYRDRRLLRPVNVAGSADEVFARILNSMQAENQRI